MRFSGEFCHDLFDLARSHNGRNVDVEIDGMPVLIVQRAEDADWVLRRNAANYGKNLNWFRQLLGASRLTEDGEAWRLRQALTQHGFNTFDRQRCFQLCLAHAETALEALVASSADGAAVIDDNVFHTLTLNVMMESFFGRALDKTAIDMRALTKLIEFGSVYALKRPGGDRLPRENLLELPRLRKIILDGFGIFRRAPLADHAMIAPMLELDGDARSDFIIEHELVTFFIGGSEAPAAALGWACYLLALYPDVQEEVRRSLQPFWDQESPDAVQLAKIASLASFVSEALRLFPPVPALARLSIDADDIGRDHVEAGRNVAISMIGLQYDRRFRRDPWRLDLDAAARPAPGAGDVVAFGSGPRICGGKQFALAELTAILSVFLRGARFELTSSAPPRFKWRSQMVREGGHPVATVRLDRPGRRDVHERE